MPQTAREYFDSVLLPAIRRHSGTQQVLDISAQLDILLASDQTVEALIPRFSQEVKPYDKDKLSRMVEPDREKFHKGEVGVQDNSELEDVDIGADNIIAVWNKAKRLLSPEEFTFWTKWYEHAHEDVKTLAQKYNIPLDLMAGVVAALSPNTKWIPNLGIAERTVRLAASFLEYGGRKDFEHEITKTAKLVKDLLALEKKWSTKVSKEKIPMGMRGEVYEQLGKIRRMLNQQRARYQGYDKEYKALVKKHLGGLVGSEEKPGNFMDSYPKNIRKALNMIEDYQESPSPEAEKATSDAAPATVTNPAIKKWLQGPKVEAFYRALLMPTLSTHELVKDGHVVQLWLGKKDGIKQSPKPLGNRGRKIEQSFKKAAQELGVSVRAVQSLTWMWYKFVVENDIEIPGKLPYDVPF